MGRGRGQRFARRYARQSMRSSCYRATLTPQRACERVLANDAQRGATRMHECEMGPASGEL
eukprot:6776817-Lingulodinium_polyedra.AAC.1